MFKNLLRVSTPVIALMLSGLVTNASPAAASAVQMQRPFVQPHASATPQFVHGATASTNWSGYAATGKTFSNVSGSWTEPAVSCPSRQTQAASFWVGIDGYNSSTVEQTGTDSDCVNGHAQYYAWYELYPAASSTLSTSTYPVAPGDVLTASVVESNGSYTLTLSDKSVRLHNWTFTTTVNNSSATNASAEWIAEAPSLCNRFSCSVLPLSNFGLVNFTGASTTGDGVSGSISAFTNSQITMVNNNGTPIATPSSLNSGGTAFTVQYNPVSRHSSRNANRF